MRVGKLQFVPFKDQPELVASPVSAAIRALHLPAVEVVAIDAELADTATFCEHYDIAMAASANCVIVEAKRGAAVWHAACLVLATTRADVNNTVRRHLDARKISFAPMATATALSGMMYGGITPIGLPADWPVLVDERVAAAEHVIIGSGLRASKLLVPGRLLADLPASTVLDIVKT